MEKIKINIASVMITVSLFTPKISRAVTISDLPKETASEIFTYLDPLSFASMSYMSRGVRNTLSMQEKGKAELGVVIAKRRIYELIGRFISIAPGNFRDELTGDIIKTQRFAVAEHPLTSWQYDLVMGSGESVRKNKFDSHSMAGLTPDEWDEYLARLNELLKPQFAIVYPGIEMTVRRTTVEESKYLWSKPVNETLPDGTVITGKANKYFERKFDRNGKTNSQFNPRGLTDGQIVELLEGNRIDSDIRYTVDDSTYVGSGSPVGPWPVACPFMDHHILRNSYTFYESSWTFENHKNISQFIGLRPVISLLEPTIKNQETLIDISKERLSRTSSQSSLESEVD